MGDLILVVDNDIIKKGVDINAPIVIDIDDKITTIKEKDTKENRYKAIMRGKNSLIGETSNCATTYHNKTPRSIEQRKKYESYIDLLSVINGKAIDAAKTGVIFNIPRHIAKYGKPLPYFMKYASNYYKGLKTFSKSQSNLNRLCFELEKWDKTVRFKRTYRDFDYKIMIDSSIPINKDKLIQIDRIYMDYCKEVAQLGRDQAEIRKTECKDFVINWNFYYQKYKERCRSVCSNEKELANYSVILCYERYKNKNKKFMWVVAENGILQNIKQEIFMLPTRDANGEYEYLGKKYSFKEYDGGIVIDK